MLIHVIYASQATQPFTKEARDLLLQAARTKNARLGVSGMLLMDGDSLFQVLEGEEGQVRPLVARIFADPRHRSVAKLIDEPITARDFPSWTMGYSGARREELILVPGLNDFFAAATSFTEMSPGRARKLLEAFREGRWRRTIA